MRGSGRWFGVVRMLGLVAALVACDSGGGASGTDVGAGADTAAGQDVAASDAPAAPDTGVSGLCARIDNCPAEGTSECVGATSRRVCERDPNGCLLWSFEEPCAFGLPCTDGVCSDCMPDCTGRECGDDGCGRSCGDCPGCDGPDPALCDPAGFCLETCCPRCDGRLCGDDGCGGACGVCAAPAVCDEGGQCCTPTCTEGVCGNDDGCGGRCGCADGLACAMVGTCVADPLDCIGYAECIEPCEGDAACIAPCDDKTPFEAFDTLGAMYTCLREKCGDATTDEAFNACFEANCLDAYYECYHRDKPCGWVLGCIGECDSQACISDCFPEGTVEAQDEANAVLSCVLEACDGELGTFEDACVVTATTEGGACAADWTKCRATCTPTCEGRACGTNDCGGSCGTCDAGWFCNDAFACEECVPECDGRTCGDDGCGGVCGTCTASQACEAGTCVEFVCVHEGFDPTVQAAEYDGTAAEFMVTWRGQTGSTAPFDAFRIEVYATPDYGGPTTAGTYPVLDQNYRDCGLCLLTMGECSAQGCEKLYLAFSGEVVIDKMPARVGQAFGGTVSNVRFREVTINSAFVSTAVPEGETWCVEGFSFVANTTQMQ